MSDVLQTATKYRTRLKAELAKVEGFLHMAEEFSKESDPEARLAFAKTTAKAMPAEPPALELARRTPKEAAAS
jgi:hypothetical protein